MKKIIGITTAIVVIIAAVLFVGSGFQKRTDVILLGYAVEENGNTMLLDVTVESPIGFTRDVSVKQGGDALYLTFYNTFGLNSKLGAKMSHYISLPPGCKEVYFYTGDGGYQLVLQQNETASGWNIVADFPKGQHALVLTG